MFPSYCAGPCLVQNYMTLNIPTYYPYFQGFNFNLFFATSRLCLCCAKALLGDVHMPYLFYSSKRSLQARNWHNSVEDYVSLV